MSSLPGRALSTHSRGNWMRVDTVQILKRFFFCERSLLIGLASWLPHIGPMNIKVGLPRFIWQNAQTAHALRRRVFELRFPSKVMEEEGADADLVTLFRTAKDAPSARAFLLCVGRTLLPALRDGYRAFLEESDRIADGPTHRFLSQALVEKEEQIRMICQWAEEALTEPPESPITAREWNETVAQRLAAFGGVGISSPATPADARRLPGSHPLAVPDQPARDPSFWPCRFYWPDIVDPSYPYGEKITLQLRSAISHLNEAWAVETGGIILSSFADVLPWEWLHDSARWTYDEARHCQMGYERLLAWGLEPAETPLGTYIYESSAKQDPIYRLGMLYFFETKNIGHKRERTQLFHTYGDALSEHDMDFDWADETLHASYGRHWLSQLLVVRGQDPSTYEAIRERCGELVVRMVGLATEDEVAALKEVAGKLLAKVEGVL